MQNSMRIMQITCKHMYVDPKIYRKFGMTYLKNHVTWINVQHRRGTCSCNSHNNTYFSCVRASDPHPNLKSYSNYATYTYPRTNAIIVYMHTSHAHLHLHTRINHGYMNHNIYHYTYANNTATWPNGNPFLTYPQDV